MNTQPISFRIAAVCLSILLGGSYLAYRTFAARGSVGTSPADFLPGSKSRATDSSLMPGSKSPGVPHYQGDPNLLPGSKSITPFSFGPVQPAPQSSSGK